MKLWLLSRTDEELPYDDNPWIPWYDKANGFVVRAETEPDARQLANAEGENEKGPTRFIFDDRYGGDPWLDPKYSTCVELTADGESCVILRDFEAS